MATPVSDPKREREEDVTKILSSDHPKKVVVAGAGTGKSFLFQKSIEKKKADGKDSFLAITFIGKLGDALADDLAGMAETTTMHGFAREFVLGERPDAWRYYPKMFGVIKEDLDTEGITDFKVGDACYTERTNYYKAVGEDDVVHYAVEICKNDKSKIPIRDLILIDEFQDFNEIEDEFIGLLAEKNEVLIVGDDDQALYKFKGSHPKYIRAKHDSSNYEFESHTLRFCSRCPEVVVNAFHNLVGHYQSEIIGRIDKDYLYYHPDKADDSRMNPKLIKMDAQPGQLPFKIRTELTKMLKDQNIKSVLIIGEGRTCKAILSSTAGKLVEFGFRNVNYSALNNGVYSIKSHVIEAYKALASGDNPLLAWRLLLFEIETDSRKKMIHEKFADPKGIVELLPEQFKKEHIKASRTLQTILSKPKSERDAVVESLIARLMEKAVADREEDRNIFIDQILRENKHLSRPLGNLDITVSTILGSKGLGADVVFLVGFDEGRIPVNDPASDDEIFQMLVALTRTKKRFYMISTTGRKPSSFLNGIGAANIG